jgi:hypothetical protein
MRSFSPDIVISDVDARHGRHRVVLKRKASARTVIPVPSSAAFENLTKIQSTVWSPVPLTPGCHFDTSYWQGGAPDGHHHVEKQTNSFNRLLTSFTHATCRAISPA